MKYLRVQHTNPKSDRWIGMMCRVQRIDFVVRRHRPAGTPTTKLIGPAGTVCHLPSFAHCCSVCWFVDPDLGGTRKAVAQGFIQERPSVFPTQVPHCQLNRQNN